MRQLVASATGVSEDTLIAMIAVGPKLSGDAFYQHDLDLLMTLANQAGVAIKNAQLYAAVVVANEYIENIAATIESGVIAIDATGRVAMFNRAAEHMTGLVAESTKGGHSAALPPAWPSRCSPPSATGRRVRSRKSSCRRRRRRPRGQGAGYLHDFAGSVRWARCLAPSRWSVISRH